MGSPSWENLDAFLSTADFAALAVITHAGTPRTVKCIFDAPYMLAELGEYDADAYEPRILCKASDVSDIVRGDTVQVNGTTYNVVTDAQQDGTGMATLKMAVQA